MSKFFAFLKGKRPDLTAAQIVAVFTWVGSQAVAYGWISNSTEQRYLSITSTVFAFGLKYADVLLRSARNKADSATAAQK